MIWRISETYISGTEAKDATPYETDADALAVIMTCSPKWGAGQSRLTLSAVSSKAPAWRTTTTTALSGRRLNVALDCPKAQIRTLPSTVLTLRGQRAWIAAPPAIPTNRNRKQDKDEGQ